MDSLSQDTLKLSGEVFQPVSSDTFLQMFFYLIFVLLLILGIAFLLQKMGVLQKNISSALSDQLIQVLGHTIISPKEKIIAIKLVDQVKLILITEHSSLLIAEFPLSEFSNYKPKENPSFNDVFKRVLKKNL